MINKTLHQEDEIIVELGNEAINVVWVVSIFEIVQTEACKDSDELKNKSFVLNTNYRHLDHVKHRE